MSEISFRLHKGLLYIPMTIVCGEQSVTLPNCIFDTGAAGTTFDVDEVSPIGIHAMPENPLRRLVTIGGYQTVFLQTVETLCIGEEMLNAVEVEFGNLQSKFGIQGIVGTDVMQRFDWELRFSTQQLIITSSTLA